jgi:serine/threonine protein kinase
MLSNFAEGLVAFGTSTRNNKNTTGSSVGPSSTKTVSRVSSSSSSSSRKKRPLPRQYKLSLSVSVIQDYVDRVTSESPLLQRQQENVARLQCSRSALSIGKVVGEGSFSQVRMARGKHSHKPIVIKQLHSKLFLASSSSSTAPAQKALDQAAADLVLEALYLSSLHHPHVVAVQSMFTQLQSQLQFHHSDVFVCLEHFPLTLADKMMAWRRSNQHLGSPGPLLRNTQLKYATQLASAMCYLHEQGLILRDIKPDNIGIGHDDTVKVFDLGLCRELPPASTAVIVDSEPAWHMTLVGTMRYCAGEVLTRQSYNAKCDVYSFAIVLYELVTLQTAFPTIDINSEQSRQDHIEKVCIAGKRPGLSLYQLPADVERIIRKSWQRSIAKRWNSQQVHEALQALLASHYST